MTPEPHTDGPTVVGETDPGDLEGTSVGHTGGPARKEHRVGSPRQVVAILLLAALGCGAFAAIGAIVVPHLDLLLCEHRDSEFGRAHLRYLPPHVECRFGPEESVDGSSFVLRRYALAAGSLTAVAILVSVGVAAVTVSLTSGWSARASRDPHR